MRLLLDTEVLGQICHPRRYGDVRAWFRSALKSHAFIVSELADHELRRELVRIGAQRSVARLDELGRELLYAPVSTSVWRRAASLWAATRLGDAKASPETLDSHVLMAAQAIEEDATVVTASPARFDALGVMAAEWKAIPPA